MRIAKVLSYITHPILITTYMLAYILFQQNSYLYYTVTPSGRWFFLGISVVLTIIAPLISVGYLVYSKQVTSFYLDNRKERIVPMAITVAYTFGLYYFLQKLSLPPILIAMVGVSIVGVATTLLITLLWKISAHMMGIAGFTGVILSLANGTIPTSSTLIILLFILSGMVGSARIKQDSHSLSQVVAGWVLGLSLSFATMNWLTQYPI